MEDMKDFLAGESTFLRQGIMIPRRFNFDFVLILHHTQMKDLYIIFWRKAVLYITIIVGTSSHLCR